MSDKLTIADVRPEVLAFALLMERKLRLNDHRKGGRENWLAEEPEWLFKRIAVETAELGEELNKGRPYVWEPWSPGDDKYAPGFPRIVRRLANGRFEQASLFARNPFAPTEHRRRMIGEAADIANFAMMVADVAGALAEAPETPAVRVLG